MDNPAFAALKRLQAEARALQTAVAAFVSRLDLLVADQAQGKAAEAPVDLKRPDGRLSDAGIAAMEAMFAEGRTVTEIAKAFNCTVSAASHRKRIWQAKGNATG